jgi:sugar/nucleoside kinase (ribokinase family)
VALRQLWALLGPGADLLVTQGDEGGLLIRLGADGPAEMLRYRSPASDAEVDPTGAGDTFLAALHASGMRPVDRAGAGAGDGSTPTATTRDAIRDRLDLRFAAAAGSLVVEGWGLAGVPNLAAVTARLERDHAPDGVEPIGIDEAARFWPEGMAVD